MLGVQHVHTGTGTTFIYSDTAFIQPIQVSIHSFIHPIIRLFVHSFIFSVKSQHMS